MQLKKNVIKKKTNKQKGPRIWNVAKTRKNMETAYKQMGQKFYSKPLPIKLKQEI